MIHLGFVLLLPQVRSTQGSINLLQMSNKPKQTKLSLNKAPKRDEEYFRDMVDGSRKVMSKSARMAYEYQCDPFNNPNHPKPQRGLSRRGDTLTLNTEVVITVGTGGIGYCVFSPDYFILDSDLICTLGPYNDVNLYSSTTVAFTGNSLPASSSGAITGVTNGSWPSATTPYAAASTLPSELMWQCNGGGMELINSTNRLAADGAIYCYQSMNNASELSLNIAGIESTKRYTEVSGAVYAQGGKRHIFPHKLTDASIEASGNVESTFNQLSWNCTTASRAGSASPVTGGSIIMVLGTAGNTVRVKLSAGYSLVGRYIPPRLHFLSDSRSADILVNLIMMRLLPSWFGHPSMAQKGFLSHAYAFIKKHFLSEAEKRVGPALTHDALTAGKFLWKELGLDSI